MSSEAHPAYFEGELPQFSLLLSKALEKHRLHRTLLRVVDPRLAYHIVPQLVSQCLGRQVTILGLESNPDCGKPHSPQLPLLRSIGVVRYDDLYTKRAAPSSDQDVRHYRANARSEFRAVQSYVGRREERLFSP